MQERVFNMSGELPAGVNASEVLDFSGLEGTSCYCDDDNVRMISGRLAELQSAGPVLNWIDTGDYHYLSALTMSGIREDFVLLLIDRHPDTLEPAFGEVLSCGGWVRSLLRSNEKLRSAILFGTDPALEPEYADLLENGQGACGCRLTVSADASSLASIRPGLPAYVSIDLDVLSRDYARTDWDQGGMSPDELKYAVGTFLSGRRLLGVDICGGLTDAKGATSEDDSVNAAIRRDLSRFFASLLPSNWKFSLCTSK